MLAYGGGSVIDCCKIVAAQAKTDKDLWEMEMTEHQCPTDDRTALRSSGQRLYLF